jgi:DNA-binding NtrC family response regulator
MTEPSQRSGTSRLTSGVRALTGAEVLVIDQDERVTKGMTQLLSAAELHVTAVQTPEAGLELLDRRFFSVIIVDLDTPTPNSGLDTIRAVKDKAPTSMVVVLTPRKAFDDSVEAIRAGAIDIILKSPESVQYLRERILEAAGRSVGKREVASILIEVRDAQEDFLKSFMDAERRALDAADQLAGRSAEPAPGEEIRVLVVEPTGKVIEALQAASPGGYAFESALSGGQALDMCTSSKYQMAMVTEALPDLPGSMVVRSIKTQNQDMVVILFVGPGPGGKVEIVEASRNVVVVDEFTDVAQILGRMDELAEAFRAKARERRYTQAFRERHYDFLRRYVELKIKIDRTIGGE